MQSVEETVVDNYGIHVSEKVNSNVQATCQHHTQGVLVNPVCMLSF